MENLENEIWKDIEGYESLYQISNMGRIKSFYRGKEKITKGYLHTRGYKGIALSKNGITKRYLIHRLVAQAFCYNDDPINKIIVNHINEIKDDNRACNLEWVTPKENTLHSSYKISNTHKGYRKDGKRVKCIETGKIFNSIKEASISINRASSSIIGSIERNGTCGGLHWEYVNEEDMEFLQLDGEIWKPIEGYEGLYEVSNLGRVKSLNYRMSGKPRILKQNKNNRGYINIVLCKNSYQKTFSLHWLVAKYFCEGYKEGLVINHKNEIKTDNRAINLEWITQQENTKYSSYKNNNNEYNSKCVIGINKGIFKSLTYAGYKTGVSSQSILQAIKRNGTSAGCHWKYLNYKHNVILIGKDISKLHKNDKRLE